jgi:DnaJ family protein C protein 8
LLRPGSTYFNLNPFEVLQVDPYTSVDEIKKKYRKLSMYVHPDKNPNDKERAQVAFEALNRAYKLLDDEKQRKMCLEVVDEAREKVDQMVSRTGGWALGEGRIFVFLKDFNLYL